MKTLFTIYRLTSCLGATLGVGLVFLSIIGMIVAPYDIEPHVFALLKDSMLYGTILSVVCYPLFHFLTHAEISVFETIN